MKNKLLAGLAGLSLFFSVGSGYLYANDGVYVSSSTVKPDVDQLMSEYVRIAVINSVLESTGKLVERVVRGQNIQLYPQMAGLAVQQISQQVFKQDELMEISRDAYNDSLELLKVQRIEGLGQNELQSNAKQNIKEILEPMYALPLYQKVVEEVLKLTMQEQQRFIVLQAAQRQAQMMMIQQRINQMQQAVIQTYLANMTGGQQ